MRPYLAFAFIIIIGVINYLNAQNSPQVIVDDMTLDPDAALHGVPSYYSWASGEANFQSLVPAKNSQGEW